jgi:hypothetical protein
LKGILLLHKFVINQLHTDYTTFTEWVDEAQNNESQGTSEENPNNTARLPLLTPPSTKGKEVERGQRESETHNRPKPRTPTLKTKRLERIPKSKDLY